MSWIRPGTRVALIGNSQMQSLGPRLRSALESAGVSVPTMEVRVGWSLRRYLNEANIEQLTSGADVVIVELGGNDAAGGVTPTRHATDVAEFLRRSRAPHLIWMGPSVSNDPPLEARREAVRRAQQPLIERAGGLWIDGSALTRTSDLNDSVHFKASGYDDWARRLFPILMRAGSSSAEWIGPAAIAGAGAIALGGIGWYFWRSRRRRR